MYIFLEAMDPGEETEQFNFQESSKECHKKSW